jgi:hypothetical protein
MKALSHRTQALLRASRDARNPSPQELLRVRRSLLLKVAAASAIATGAGTAAAGSSVIPGAGSALGSLLALPGIAKIAVAVAVISGGSLGTALWVRSGAKTDPVTLAVPAAPRAASPAAASAVVTEAAPSPRAAPNAQAPVEVESAPRASRASAANEGSSRTSGGSASPARNAPEDALLEEARLLTEAQRQLGAGRAARALETLAQYDARFPSGSLRVEADAARVFALCQSGRSEQARAAGARFLRRYPASPAAKRVREACRGE